MELRRVGSTDVRLSVIGLGGAWLGHDRDDPSDLARALSVLRTVDETGVNWVDTSENYFDTGNESVIGLALRDMPDAFLVCSKVAPGALRSGGGSGFKPEQVRRACESSLERIGREHLDVYLLHWPDESGVPLADTWGAMEALVADGLVRSIGLSNYERDDIARCHEQRSVDVIQNGLSLIDHLDEQETIAWCGDQGIAATIYEPIGSGVLSDTPLDEVREHWVGTAWEDTPFFRRMFSPTTESRTRRVVDGVREIAEDIGVPTSQVALAWVLRQPGVTSAIAGSRNPDRARSNALAADVELSDAALQALNDLIPLGPWFV